MYRISKILKYIMPLWILLILVGCAGNISDGVGNMDVLSLEDVESENTSSDLEGLTMQGLYHRLGEEIGFDYLGGIYYTEDTDTYGIWLKQEAYDKREGRELTACESALEQAVNEGRLNIRIGKYSVQELRQFQDRISSLFCERGIFASGLNERENKVSVYVNEWGDFTELYELVPEDAVLLQYIPVDSMELIEL